MSEKKDIWIAGITRGHNSGVCLLKNGEIVFAIEEERLTRRKYDGGPMASILKILEYTDRLDYVGFAHTQPMKTGEGSNASIEFINENIYPALLRKVGLIDRHTKYNVFDAGSHPQVYDFGMEHHRLHAWCAFIRSGWSKATTLVVDGAGTFIPIKKDGSELMGWEVESVYHCDLEEERVISTVFKHIGCRDTVVNDYTMQISNNFDHMKEHEPDWYFNCLLTDRAGTVKAYEAVTGLCGWQYIEAGKTMGLSPYGKENDIIPDFYDRDYTHWPVTNRNWIIPTYPNGAQVNQKLYFTVDDVGEEVSDDKNSYDYQLTKDISYKLQKQTQDAVLSMILKTVEFTGEKRVVLTGGYALNCVANYYFLNKLKEEGIELFVEPISNDAGTALGAAFWTHHKVTGEAKSKNRDIYLGPAYSYTVDDINALAEKYDAVITDSDDNNVVDLITKKNIVTVFQGRCENGPRALGNRSILYDPTDPNGKDHVNSVKNREFFRPFAGSILKEHVHEWFDLRGMEDTPHMMYAVECQPGIGEKIPSIIHEDGTCRIQTVTEEQNPNYYRLIKTFYEKTGCPIIFNTSFNLGGEPLVETLDDGFRTLANSKIEYMYLPEYGKMIYIKNKE